MKQNAAINDDNGRLMEHRSSAGILRHLRWTKILLAALLTAGCSEIRRDYIGYSSTDLSSVHVGTSRRAVEDVLGRPMTGYNSNAGRVETYKYNKGIEPKGDLDLSDAAGAVLLLGLEVLFWPIAVPSDLASGACDVEGQKGLLNVTYDDFETVMAVEEENYRPSSACD
jgi:hypothetical protein